VLFVSYSGPRLARLEQPAVECQTQVVEKAIGTHVGEALSEEAILAISRSLADPRRFAILQQIAGKSGMLCSGLSMHECIRPATISHHLKELQNAGLITAEREGRNMRLALRREVWEAYLRTLSSL